MVWSRVVEQVDDYWTALHPAYARAKLIADLVEQANAFPAGLKTANGSQWVPNSANYALFTILVPGEQGVCLRTISGRETGGTYDHRVGYGFVFNQPEAVPAYGLPQSNPPSKLLAAGSDAYTNPVKQIRWMEGYTYARYGSPCAALGHHRSVTSAATY